MSLDNILNIPSISILFLALLSLVQIAPIKVNPWSWLFGKFGEWASKPLEERVKQIQEDMKAISGRVTEIEKRTEDREVKKVRLHLYKFADDVVRGKLHSEEYYNEILDDISQYESYCNLHPDFENGKADVSIKIIKEGYEAYKRNGGFLTKEEIFNEQQSV